MSDITSQEILTFWKEAGSKKWFAKDDEFDAAIRQKFGHLLNLESVNAMTSWQDEADSCLAFIILYDQFPRNVFRNDAKAFSFDKTALAAAKKAVSEGYLQSAEADLKSFMIMPFMHSENINDQLECIKLMKKHSGENSVKFAIIHYDIINEFGRFPHRNEVFGRKTTAEELVFLNGDGFKG